MKNQTNHARHNVGLILSLVGFMSAATLLLGPARFASAQASAPSWSNTGNLNTGRNFHTATLLPNGSVLVAGGLNYFGTGPALESAELYNPATGVWSNTGNLNVARAEHTATLMPNGKILVTGGTNCFGEDCISLNSAELYDPVTGAWSSTGSLSTAHNAHTATLLPNEKVLVVGGGRGAELYDPTTGTWSSTGNLKEGHGFSHSATLLANGKVLVTGGFGSAGSAELYDPMSGTWGSTGNLNVARAEHTATLLTNGRVLITGGGNYVSGFFHKFNSAELYDPATGTWSITGNLNDARGSHSATLLPNGNVLVAGGFNDTELPKRTELYDLATGAWSLTATLNTGHYANTATLLLNGKVLVVGAHSAGDNSAELYDPGTNVNQIDDAEFFITQQYKDFLRRLPEAGPDGIYGTADDPMKFYLDILNGCNPNDIECIKYTRGALSANFFRSPEFERKGLYVMYLYMVSIGQRPVTPAELSNSAKVDRPHCSEFMADLESISTPNDDPAFTESKKAALADAWMLRAEIQAKYPSNMSATDFVDALLQTADVTLPAVARDSLIMGLHVGQMTRAQILREIAERPEVNDKFYKAAFVTMEYFGYLRRDPEDCHNSQNWTGNDPNQCGYIFHNNRFNLGFDPAHVENIIVRGFIESLEYRHRFGA